MTFLLTTCTSYSSVSYFKLKSEVFFKTNMSIGLHCTGSPNCQGHLAVNLRPSLASMIDCAQGNHVGISNQVAYKWVTLVCKYLKLAEIAFSPARPVGAPTFVFILHRSLMSHRRYLHKFCLWISSKSLRLTSKISAAS